LRLRDVGVARQRRIEFSAVNTVPATKIYSSLSPRTNVTLMCTWAVVIAFGFSVLSPHLPFALGVVGGVLGAVAGIFQHLSIKQNPEAFISAFSLKEVNLGFKTNRWGRTYIAWGYLSTVVLALLAFALISTSFRVLFGYLVAEVSFMLVREIITLRDTITLRTLRERAAPETVG
jgi:hypothetical protein